MINMAFTEISRSSLALLQLYGKLNTQNFRNWKLGVTKIMDENEVKYVLNVRNPEDLTDPTKKTSFIRDDAIAKHIILESITHRETGYIQEAKTSQQMMNKLCEIYEEKCTSARLMVMKRLLNLKCGPEEDLEVHFHNMELIFDELSCMGSKINEADKISLLLLSMDEKYKVVLADVETMSGELKLDFIKNLLFNYDRKFKEKSSTRIKNVSKKIKLDQSSSHQSFGSVAGSSGRNEIQTPAGLPEQGKLTVLSKIPIYVDCQKSRCLTCKIAIQKVNTTSRRRVDCTSKNTILRLTCRVKGCDWAYITCTTIMLSKKVSSLPTKVTVDDHAARHGLYFEDCFELLVLKRGNINLSKGTLKERCEYFRRCLLVADSAQPPTAQTDNLSSDDSWQPPTAQTDNLSSDESWQPTTSQTDTHSSDDSLLSE